MEESIKDLEQQLKNITNIEYNNSISSKLNIFNLTYSNFFKKSGLYIILYIFTLILIAILGPKSLYKTNPLSNKQQFLWKKYFFISFIVYLLLISIILFWNQYLIKKL